MQALLIVAAVVASGAAASTACTHTPFVPSCDFCDVGQDDAGVADAAVFADGDFTFGDARLSRDGTSDVDANDAADVADAPDAADARDAMGDGG